MGKNYCNFVLIFDLFGQLSATVLLLVDGRRVHQCV